MLTQRKTFFTVMLLLVAAAVAIIAWPNGQAGAQVQVSNVNPEVTWRPLTDAEWSARKGPQFYSGSPSNATEYSESDIPAIDAAGHMEWKYPPSFPAVNSYKLERQLVVNPVYGLQSTYEVLEEEYTGTSHKDLAGPPGFRFNFVITPNLAQGGTGRPFRTEPYEPFTENGLHAFGIDESKVVINITPIKNKYPDGDRYYKVTRYDSPSDRVGTVIEPNTDATSITDTTAVANKVYRYHVKVLQRDSAIPGGYGEVYTAGDVFVKAGDPGFPDPTAISQNPSSTEPVLKWWEPTRIHKSQLAMYLVLRANARTRNPTWTIVATPEENRWPIATDEDDDNNYQYSIRYVMWPNNYSIKQSGTVVYPTIPAPRCTTPNGTAIVIDNVDLTRMTSQVPLHHRYGFTLWAFGNKVGETNPVARKAECGATIDPNDWYVEQAVYYHHGLSDEDCDDPKISCDLIKHSSTSDLKGSDFVSISGTFEQRTNPDGTMSKPIWHDDPNAVVERGLYRYVYKMCSYSTTPGRVCSMNTALSDWRFEGTTKLYFEK